MTELLSAEEVALLIRGRQILKAKGLAKDADVKSICEAGGVSRKTGYSWARSLGVGEREESVLKEEIGRVKAEHEELKKRYDHLYWENEGRKLAWEIHGVEEFLAAKKNTAHKGKKKRQ